MADIKDQYVSGVTNYRTATMELGLWQSESAVIDQYFRENDEILDLGCGTGRTTFGLLEKGFSNIIGVDITPEMIACAKEIAKERKIKIEFQVGDATALSFADCSFAGVLFSFNGLFSIPTAIAREKAFAEVCRILRPGGLFIFTSHDRDIPGFSEYWRQEARRWQEGVQDERLHEFGDRIAESGHENTPIYIHIPSQKEVQVILEKEGFKLIDTFLRDERYQESDMLLSKSVDCRFWIARKSLVKKI